MEKNYYLYQSARDAYRGYVLSYQSHKLKECYDVFKLDLQRIAKSFGFSGIVQTCASLLCALCWLTDYTLNVVCLLFHRSTKDQSGRQAESRRQRHEGLVIYRGTKEWARRRRQCRTSPQRQGGRAAVEQMKNSGSGSVCWGYRLRSVCFAIPPPSVTADRMLCRGLLLCRPLITTSVIVRALTTSFLPAMDDDITAIPARLMALRDAIDQVRHIRQCACVRLVSIAHCGPLLCVLRLSLSRLSRVASLRRVESSVRCLDWWRSANSNL